jgi:spermidine synthase
MSWRSYIVPQTICITTSPYNHLIRVNEERGKMKLLVNGSPQSGAYIAYLWKKAFDAFSIRKNHPKNALLLGIGGGTVVSFLSEYFPGISQTCVDIDSVIIDIAKRYFHIDTISNIHIVHSDGKKYVDHLYKKKKKFDCIIIDLFIGRNIPSFVKDESFLKTIKTLLSPKGFVCINYLREKEYKSKSNILNAIVHTLFSETKDFEIANNRFFYCR